MFKKDLYITISDNIITKKGKMKMKLELKIINLLAKNPAKRFAINEIAKTLKEHYSFVHRTANKLIKDAVIIKDKVGKSHLCSLNLNNEKTLALIQLSEIEKRDEFYNVNKELELALEDFVKAVAPYSFAVVLFGSYAKGTAAKESDIDVLVINKKEVEIDKITKEIYAKYGKEITAITMSMHDFERQRDQAIIKEIIGNHYVLHGIENFVNLVFRK